MSVVTRSFDRAAPTYLANAAVQTELARWLSDWLPENRNGRAVEIGAGPGLFTRHLIPWSGPLTATDASPLMCAIGKNELPQVRWRRMSAESPNEGPWEWIFSSSMLQWAEHPAELFSAWRAQLAPGGRVLAGLFAAGSLSEWNELAGGAAPLTWRAAEAWRASIVDSGLRLRRDETERRPFRYPSALALLRSIHGTGGAPSRRFSPAALRRLLRDYESRHASADGVPASWVFYRFEAEKARS
jgi:SAM-dependent methyltransferase